MKNYLKILLKSKKLILKTLLFSLSFVLLDIVVPYILSYIIQIISKNEINILPSYIVAMIITVAISSIGIILLEKFSTEIAVNVSSLYRKKIFLSLIDDSREKYSRKYISGVLTRNTQDVNQIRNFTKTLFNTTIVTFVVSVFSIYLFVEKAISLVFPIIELMIILLIILIAILLGVNKYAEKLEGLIEKVNGKIYEILDGFETIITLNKMNFEKRKLSRLYNKSKKVNERYYFLSDFISPIFDFIIILMNSYIYYLYSVESGKIGNTQELIVLIEVADQLIFSIAMISFALTNIPRTTISLRKINNLLELNDSSDCMRLNSNFHLKKIHNDLFLNKKILFVGSSESGKTRFLNTIIANFERKYSLMRQDAFLFNGTIGENIFFECDSFNEQQINKILEISNVDQILKGKKSGLNSNVSNNGQNFSGGERQRIEIARTLAKEADVYFFDNSFTALDYITMNNILNGIFEYLKNKSILICSQRVILPEEFDRIYFFYEGDIKSVGTHEELLEKDNAYKEYYLRIVNGERYE